MFFVLWTLTLKHTTFKLKVHRLHYTIDTEISVLSINFTTEAVGAAGKLLRVQLLWNFLKVNWITSAAGKLLGVQLLWNFLKVNCITSLIFKHLQLFRALQYFIHSSSAVIKNHVGCLS